MFVERRKRERLFLKATSTNGATVVQITKPGQAPMMRRMQRATELSSRGSGERKTSSLPEAIGIFLSYPEDRFIKEINGLSLWYAPPL
jgi:hypothetical protein